MAGLSCRLVGLEVQSAFPTKAQSTVYTVKNTRMKDTRQFKAPLTTMALVADDYVANSPVFTTPMPEGGVVWPSAGSEHPVCPMCDQPSSGFEKIEGGDALGMTAAMVAPVSVRRVHSIQAPICPEHDDGVALFVSGSELELGFRSRAYQLRFEALNSTPNA